MSEGYSRAMKSASGRPPRREDSFRELKEMVAIGYERFWQKPHRRMFKPSSPDFGCFDFSPSSQVSDEPEGVDEFDSLT